MHHWVRYIGINSQDLNIGRVLFHCVPLCPIMGQSESFLQKLGKTWKSRGILKLHFVDTLLNLVKLGFHVFGVYYFRNLGFICRKNWWNSVLVLYGMPKFGFYRGFAWVISHISVFSLSTSAKLVFIRLLSTWLKTKITCIIIISAKGSFGVFGIDQFQIYFIRSYFSVIIGNYQKRKTLVITVLPGFWSFGTKP